MLPDGIHSYDLLRPQNPDPERPQTNEPVSVHVLEADEATVLFGTGFNSSLETLVSHLEELGGPDVIVVEHGDPDHYAALPGLLEAFPDATVAIPTQDASVLVEFGVTPDIELEHDEVRWGVRTIHLPGHTPGNMSFLQEETGTLFVGDTFVHVNSFTAAPGEWSGSFAPIKSVLNDDDQQTRESIALLADYEFELALVTHGLNTTSGARAELDKLIADLGLD